MVGTGGPLLGLEGAEEEYLRAFRNRSDQKMDTFTCCIGKGRGSSSQHWNRRGTSSALKPRCLWSPSYVNKRPSQLQHAQQFVNIKVQISWQAQHLVNFMEGRRYCHYHCHTTLPLPDYFHTTIPLPDYHTTTTLTLPQVQQSCLLTQNFVWGLLLASYELVPCESFGTISVTHAQLKWDGAAVGRRGSTLF